MLYNKPSLSISQQADRLLSRGLLCEDIPRLEQYLSRIGYYRLSAYWLVYEQGIKADGSRNHLFKADTTFDDILDLYLFDRQLRLLLLDAIERIEVAIRTTWATTLTLEHGAHAFLDRKFFKNNHMYNRGIKKIEEELGRSRETFIQHYQNKYTSPVQPPLWAIVEVLSFGNLSRWIENTASTKVKKEIFQSFGMPSINVFQQLLKAITPLRNDCAHHSRVWNKRYTMAPPILKRISSSYNRETGKERYLYNFLVIIAYLVQQVNPKSSWRTRATEIFDTRSSWQQQLMGFPTDWKQREIWQEVRS